MRRACDFDPPVGKARRRIHAMWSSNGRCLGRSETRSSRIPSDPLPGAIDCWRVEADQPFFNAHPGIGL